MNHKYNDDCEMSRLQYEYDAKLTLSTNDTEPDLKWIKQVMDTNGFGGKEWLMTDQGIGLGCYWVVKRESILGELQFMIVHPDDFWTGYADKNAFVEGYQQIYIFSG